LKTLAGGMDRADADRGGADRGGPFALPHLPFNAILSRFRHRTARYA
jgi:hypothetical protein